MPDEINLAEGIDKDSNVVIRIFLIPSASSVPKIRITRPTKIFGIKLKAPMIKSDMAAIFNISVAAIIKMNRRK